VKNRGTEKQNEMLLQKFDYCKSHQLNGQWHWQLKMMVAYKKSKTEDKMPMMRAELYEQYILTYNHPTPPGTSVASNNREEEECDE